MRPLVAWCVNASFILLGLRLLARAPDASDPPEMHAFYHRWLQPSWQTIAAPLLLGVVVLLVVLTIEVLWRKWNPERFKDD